MRRKLVLLIAGIFLIMSLSGCSSTSANFLSSTVTPAGILSGDRSIWYVSGEKSSSNNPVSKDSKIMGFYIFENGKARYFDGEELGDTYLTFGYVSDRSDDDIISYLEQNSTFVYTSSVNASLTYETDDTGNEIVSEIIKFVNKNIPVVLVCNPVDSPIQVYDAEFEGYGPSENGGQSKYFIRKSGDSGVKYGLDTQQEISTYNEEHHPEKDETALNIIGCWQGSHSRGNSSISYKIDEETATYQFNEDGSACCLNTYRHDNKNLYYYYIGTYTVENDYLYVSWSEGYETENYIDKPDLRWRTGHTCGCGDAKIQVTSDTIELSNFTPGSYLAYWGDGIGVTKQDMHGTLTKVDTITVPDQDGLNQLISESN